MPTIQDKPVIYDAYLYLYLYIYILYYIRLDYIILYYIMLYYIMLYYNYIILDYIILYYNILYILYTPFGWSMKGMAFPPENVSETRKKKFWKTSG